ncbi:MAG: hypothetical protein Q9200_001016 [Gallowayella weberi]
MTASNQKPTFYFIHGIHNSAAVDSPANSFQLAPISGALHQASIWNAVRSSLEAHSYPTSAAKLPSSGGRHVSSHLEDTAFVRKELETLIVQEEKEVIVVMHSYGGLVGSNAVSGLEAADRKAKGGKGDIVRCVFITAYIVPTGKSLADIGDGPADFIAPDPTDSLCVIAIGPEKVFYNDVPNPISALWVAQLTPQATASFTSKMTSTVVDSGLVPCTYFLCENDQALLLSIQEEMLEAAKQWGRAKWNVERISTGHSPWLSDVDETNGSLTDFSMPAPEAAKTQISTYGLVAKIEAGVKPKRQASLPN